jgi:hypothetical protein
MLFISFMKHASTTELFLFIGLCFYSSSLLKFLFNCFFNSLAGVSRSVSLVVAYSMTVLQLPWYDALNSVRASRKQANPNFGFQRQLQNFENTSIKDVRDSLFDKYGPYDITEDLEFARSLLQSYHDEQKKLYPDKESNDNKTLDTYPLPFNAYDLDKEKKEDKTVIYPN